MLLTALNRRSCTFRYKSDCSASLWRKKLIACSMRHSRSSSTDSSSLAAWSSKRHSDKPSSAFDTLRARPSNATSLPLPSSRSGWKALVMVQLKKRPSALPSPSSQTLVPAWVWCDRRAR
ncbi:hypothetical protein D3C72_1575520 [compost metagenome]